MTVELLSMDLISPTLRRWAKRKGTNPGCPPKEHAGLVVKAKRPRTDQRIRHQVKKPPS